MKSKAVQAFDRIEIEAATFRRVTDEGYLVVPGTMARTGIQMYRAFELGLDGVSPMNVVRLYRPEDEVFNADSLKSFEGKPITINHPPVAVTADNWNEYSKGEVHDIKRAGDLVLGVLTVRSKDAIEAVNKGKNELSNGYTFDLDMTAGKTPSGEAYDGVQRNIRGNHVALVDSARCGSACRVADTNHPEGVHMKKITVDGIPVEMDDTAAGVVENVIKARDTALAAKVAADKALADAQAKHAADLKAKDAEIATIRKDVITPEARDALVADWAKLISDAGTLVKDYDHKGKTCLQVRREVVAKILAGDGTAKDVATAILAGKKIEDADADLARAVFNAVVAATPKQTKTADNSVVVDTQDALLGRKAVGDNKPHLVGRAKFLANV